MLSPAGSHRYLFVRDHRVTDAHLLSRFIGTAARCSYRPPRRQIHVQMTLARLKKKQLDPSRAHGRPSQIVVRDRPSNPGVPSRCKRRAAALVVVALAIVACRQPATARAQTDCYAGRPKILVLRGIFEVFSLGMNDLAQKLVHCGYDAQVTSWSLALYEAKCTGDRPYVIIGHSLGGRMCAWVSRRTG